MIHIVMDHLGNSVNLRIPAIFVTQVFIVQYMIPNKVVLVKGYSNSSTLNATFYSFVESDLHLFRIWTK